MKKTSVKSSKSLRKGQKSVKGKTDPLQLLADFRWLRDIEMKAAQTYHQLAKACGIPLVAKRLEAMAKEEFSHFADVNRIVQILEKFLRMNGFVFDL